jgi:hypothetical protein
MLKRESLVETYLKNLQYICFPVIYLKGSNAFGVLREFPIIKSCSGFSVLCANRRCRNQFLRWTHLWHWSTNDKDCIISITKEKSCLYSHTFPTCAHFLLGDVALCLLPLATHLGGRSRWHRMPYTSPSWHAARHANIDIPQWSSPI